MLTCERKSLTEFPAYQRLDLPVVRARNCFLQDATGRSFLDMYGGHCVNTLGAGHSALGEALLSQWEENSFVSNLLPHAAWDTFLEAMTPLLPEGDWQVFCSNSGAEANENALKLALSITGRSRVVAFEGAFHGRTAAAAAVSDLASPWPQTPFPVRQLPWGELEGIDQSCAAVLLEPIQSLAGVVTPPADWLTALKDRCRKVGALLIFDEVQTGNGRLGFPWASQYFQSIPDLFTTAKGAAGGYPIGLTFLKNELAERAPGSLCGSTFGGGPLALTAAALVAKQLQQPEFLAQVQECSQILQTVGEFPMVQKVRGAGLLLGFELTDAITAKEVRNRLLEEGILTGLCRHPNVLRICPPLSLNPQQAQDFVTRFASLEFSP
ncbi:MAG: aspartate aminotransferase family protein [Planctomycetota bacterium]|nr:MAG: aspartate aminotransferase family protein [Planctomycetota bacterium]